MPEQFDPYHEWLGIPATEQPPNHYRLLGIPAFEESPTVIESAADRQMAHLRTFQLGKRAALSQKLLNEVAAAKVCLLNPGKKAAYDERLRQTLQAAAPTSEAPAADAGFGAGLAALLDTNQPAATAKPARPKTKKSTNRASIIAAAAVVAGLVLLGLVMWATRPAGGSRESAQAERPPTAGPEAKPAVVGAPGSASAEPEAKPMGGTGSASAEAAAKPEPAEQPVPAVPEKPQRQPAPAAAVQHEIASQVDEVYKVADAHNPDQQIRLAKDLIEAAEKAAKPEERFVMLRKAAELSGEAGDAALMCQAVDLLAARFELDGLAVKEKLLAKLAIGARDAEGIKSLVESVNTLIDQALAEDRFDLALDLSNTATRACQRTQGAPFRKALVDRRKEIQTLKKQSEQIAQALEAVEANPQDADANLGAGQWYCFTKGDWAKGLPYLAKGSDEGLKALAVQESGTPPSEADGQLKLADGWWDAGQEAKGKARAAILVHAGMWYQQAQPSLPEGLVRARVEKRLDAIAALGRDIPMPPGKQPPLAVAPFDEKKALLHQKRWAKHLRVPVAQTNSIGMKLTLIPPGEFDMGSSPEEIQWATDRGKATNLHPDSVRLIPSEGPRHRVTVGKPFWLAMTEVTQAEYQQVMGSNPSNQQGDPRRPVEHVSWNDAVEFCRTLSELPAEKAAKRRYGLPTEAQWEYACRAGSPGRWCFDAQLDAFPTAVEEKLLGEYAWFGANAGGKTHPVGQKRPNAWGLYDMYGNASEWCRDWYDTEYYGKSPKDDPAGPPKGSGRANRGGCWSDSAVLCRSAPRSGGAPEHPSPYGGFRICLALGDEPGERRTVPSTEYSVPSSQAAPPASSALAAVQSATAPGLVPSPHAQGPAPPPAVAPLDAAKAKEHQEAWAKHLRVPAEATNPIGMKLVLIPPGEFTMGEGGDAHKVTITKAFYLGKYEVTQEEWMAVMGNNPSRFKGPKNPVDNVSWEDCQAFLKRLSEESGTAQRGYHKTSNRKPDAPRVTYSLPTEAQWEYACRAGSTSRYCFGDSATGLDEYGWYKGNSGGQSHSVGEKKPNAWDLFDMHGSEWEWCADWSDRGYYRASPGNDPRGPATGSNRVYRGGSWNTPVSLCESAFRGAIEPGHRLHDLGLRVSQALEDK